MSEGKAAWRLLAWIGGGLGIMGLAGWIAGSMLYDYDQNRGFQEEADRIAEVLRVQPGMNVGDIRAGRGGWAVDLARRVAPEGQVYATVSPSPPPRVLYETVASAGVDNVTVIIRTPGDAPRLPIDCCDAILVRVVYHDFVDRPALAAALFLNARPGGRLAIIDFDEGTPEHASGHGLAQRYVIEEITAAGFELEEVIEDWAGNAYCIVFRKPVTATDTEPAT